MNMQHTKDILDMAERIAGNGSMEDCLRQLRHLCLDDFALVMLGMPDSGRYPALSSVLPTMASEDVQRQWTGATGYRLMSQRVAFIEKLSRQFLWAVGRPLDGCRILDYGCGYGLSLRLLQYFTNPDRLAGCDPWDRSIRLCEEARIVSRLDITDYLPVSLPYEEETFDLVLAYSVFTHTSRKASIAALEALHPVIKPDGLLVLTIRPIEFWDLEGVLQEPEKPILRRAHNLTGFAFRPHNRPPINGDVTYGDTTMKVTMIEELCSKWKTICYDRSLSDPHQIIVLLQPASRRQFLRQIRPFRRIRRVE